MESERQVGDIEQRYCVKCNEISHMKYDGPMISSKDAMEFPNFRNFETISAPNVIQHIIFLSKITSIYYL